MSGFPFSYRVTTASLHQHVIAVPFGYIKKEHVFVKVDADVIDQSLYVWNDDANIDIAAGVSGGQLAGGEAIRVFRVTPPDELLTVLTGPSVLKHAEVNLVLLQLLYIIQEAMDIALQAQELLDQMLDILAQITVLYNEIVVIYNEIVVIWNAIKAITLYYTLAGTIPYPAQSGEFVGSYVLPSESTFVYNDATLFRGYTLTPASSGSAAFELWEYDDAEPLAASIKLGTWTFAANTDKATWVTNPAITANRQVAAGHKIMLKCSTGNGLLGSQHFAMNFRRLPLGD